VSPRFLVLDAYAPEGRAALRDADGTEAGTLYRAMLTRLLPDAQVDVAYPADPDPDLPQGKELTGYDGVCWTGSSLTIHADDPRVHRQVEFARRVYASGVPSFGSCWGAQVAVQAAGGRCAAHPRGREFGIAREIRLSERGAAHPLFAGKARVFDALTSHTDEIVELPAGTQLLASNAHSRVQAVDVQSGPGSFWAVQYHPEYDLHEVAALARLRTQELVAQGTFSGPAAAKRYIDALETLHADPTRADIGDKLGVSQEVADFEQRTREVANWIHAKVLHDDEP
jgi:GMP synthase (glutamine-hydrolysing)